MLNVRFDCPLTRVGGRAKARAGFRGERGCLAFGGALVCVMLLNPWWWFCVCVVLLDSVTLHLLRQGRFFFCLKACLHRLGLAGQKTSSRSGDDLPRITSNQSETLKTRTKQIFRRCRKHNRTGSVYFERPCWCSFGKKRFGYRQTSLQSTITAIYTRVRHLLSKEPLAQALTNNIGTQDENKQLVHSIPQQSHYNKHFLI